MIRLLFIYEEIEPSVELSIPVFDALEKTYNIAISKKRISDVTGRDIEWCDIVYCVRGQSVLCSEILRLCKRKGRLVISSYDDDFLSIKDYAVRRKLQHNAVIENIKNSDVLAVTNDNIAKKYCGINNKLKVLRLDTMVSKKEMNTNRTFDDVSILKIVYYVNDGNEDAFNGVIRKVIESMSKEERNRFDWTFIVVEPKLDDLVGRERVHYVSRMSLDEFKRFLYTGDFDIGIAPLLEEEFSSCKYINKYIEYSIAGIPCVYSNVEPYSGYVVDGADGILCNNDAHEWKMAFDKMRKPKFRESIVKNAQNKLESNYGAERLVERMTQECPELIMYKAPHDGKTCHLGFVKIKCTFLSVYDYCRRVFLRIKIDGLKSLFVLIWRHYILKKDYNEIFK